MATLCRPPLCAHCGLAEGFIIISEFGNNLWAAETCRATFLLVPATFRAYQTGRQCRRYRWQKLHNARSQAAVYAVKVRAGVLLTPRCDAQHARWPDGFCKGHQVIGERDMFCEISGFA